MNLNLFIFLLIFRLPTPQNKANRKKCTAYLGDLLSIINVIINKDILIHSGIHYLAVPVYFGIKKAKHQIGTPERNAKETKEDTGTTRRRKTNRQ